MAYGIVMGLASKKSALFSQYRRAAETLQGLFHEPGLAGAVAVVEHERGQVDGGVRQPVQRLRARRHDLRVGQVPGKEGAQLLERASFLVREIRRRRVAAL